MDKSLKTVIILATGGTIAGVQDYDGAARYRSGELTVDKIVSSVSGIEKVANLEMCQVCNVRSDNLTQTEWLKLARLINAMGKRKEVTGFVVTHGTNTMEETAYFLNLTVKVKKPVVLTGSMRPATSISADGPKNLLQAVCVAASDEAAGRNVMLVFADGIYGARDVQKQNTVWGVAFGQRDLGMQGYVLDGKPVFYNHPTRLHKADTEFDITDIERLPKVAIVYFHVDADAGLLENALQSSDGVVIAGAGNCGVSEAYIEKIEQYMGQGKVVVMSSRVGNGPVYGDFLHISEGFENVIASDTLTPQKARVLLQLALLKTKDPNEIKEMFGKY